VLDLSTLVWSVACKAGETTPYHKFFVARDELYKIGSLNDGENMMIFKYMEADNEWIKVHDASSLAEYTSRNLTLCTAGQRVYFVVTIDARMANRGEKQISVLEL
ncbi:hypothetical protein PFISCL1PPCAC_8826, partial [Pristionchus fissidentatus]